MYFYELKEVYVDDKYESTILINETKYSHDEYHNLVYKIIEDLKKHHSRIYDIDIIPILKMDYGFKEIELTGLCSFITE